MPKVIKEPVPFTTDRYYVYCPGCYEVYKERYPDQDEQCWVNGSVHCFSLGVHTYDGNAEAPTLSPSLFCQYTWGEEKIPYCCHSFINAGKIQFLGDCTHPLKNQTVDLMDVPAHLLTEEVEDSSI